MTTPKFKFEEKLPDILARINPIIDSQDEQVAATNALTQKIDPLGPVDSMLDLVLLFENGLI